MSKIEQLPELEKPREKAMTFGLEALNNAELLALLIRCGTKDVSAVQVAQRLLEKCGGIGKMSSCSPFELTQVKGISKVKALELCAVFELMRRIKFENIEDKDIIHNGKDFINWLNFEIGFAQNEAFMVVFLNKRNQILSYEIMFNGTIDRTAVYIREIMKEALLRGAKSIIVVHNHPSQSIEPSQYDMILTREIIEAGKILDIDVLDHIIVSGHESYSCMHRAQIDADLL